MQTAGISHSSKNNSKFGNCTCWSIMHTVKREANFCNCCGGGHSCHRNPKKWENYGKSKTVAKGGALGVACPQ